jgi:hypothetical protein
MGKVLLSMILGLGLATLFREVCHGKNCITFNGPVISELDGKIYKYGEDCHEYNIKSAKCNTMKKTVEIKDPKAVEIF